MGIVVPDGEYTATLVYSFSGSTKTPTCSFGFTNTELVTPSALAERIYISFTDPTVGTGPGKDDYILGGWRFEGVSVAKATSSGPLVGVYMDTVTGADTSGGAMPPNCALLLNKSTVVGGRTGRGRCYLPPVYPSETSVSQNGEVNGTYLAQLQALWDAFRTDMISDDVIPVLHHSDGSAGTPITAWNVGSLIATQRRRLR